MRLDVEVIEWVDSQGDGSWRPLGEAAKSDMSRCTSVGYIVGESDDAVTLAQSIDPGVEDERRAMVDNTVTIPKVAITSRKVLEGWAFDDG